MGRSHLPRLHRSIVFMSLIHRLSICICLICILFGQRAAAQNPPAAADTVTFANGEKLAGHLVRATGGSVTFHSDTLGDLTFDWSKVQELHSVRTFVIVPKNAKVDHQLSATSLPRGPLAV